MIKMGPRWLVPTVQPKSDSKTRQPEGYLLCSVLAAGTSYRTVPGADLQRRAGKPDPQAAAASTQKKRTPTVESFLMPCSACAACKHTTQISVQFYRPVCTQR